MDKDEEENALVPVGKLLAVTGAALPPVAVAAVGLPVAAIAFVLHLRRTKNLSSQYKAAKEALSQLVAERDSILAERDAAVRNILVLQDIAEDQADIFAAASHEAKALAKKYEETLLHTGELHARLGRAETFNQELQQTIKRERRERAEREEHIMELEKRIQEQKAVIKKLQIEHNGPFSARSDDSAKAMMERNQLELVTPPVNEGERRKASWPTKLPRPPVAFRDVSFKPHVVADP